MTNFPSTFPICHEDHHAKHIGRTQDGRQFFLTTPFVPAGGKDPGCEFIALFTFDEDGNLLEATVDKLGPRNEVDEQGTARLYQQRLESLGPVEFGDIEIAPFKVTRYDVDFGLIPQELEDDDDEPVIKMRPGNYMAFYDPWECDYDT